MQTCTQDVYQLSNFLEESFNNQAIVKTIQHKPWVSILLPQDTKIDSLKYALAADNKTHLMPVFDSTILENDKDWQEWVEIVVVDGKLMFGRYFREDDNTDSYKPKTRLMRKKNRIVDTKGFGTLSLLTSKDVDTFCKLRSKLKTQEDKNLFSALVIHTKAWYKSISHCPAFPAIQITQDVIDSGITHFVHGIGEEQFIKDFEQDGHLATTPLKAGDYIVKVCFDGKTLHLHKNKSNVEFEYTIN